ncbi:MULTISPECIES: PTS lactose/cellobiose transporter subunit IIA [unclassified Exiguobacterium]|uniref:PTS lactose/cellobiose transporter subunit IIA n=1 Tax=unclassified Exiguobacterium TaxID=2644629 RepID=UPI001BE6CC5F|nr:MULTISPECIES: PTS lactose/cellobiose transporter subunit IIA [unclassified Exiguobacterium]
MKTNEQTMEQVAFMMILHSGNARSTIREAIEVYKEESFEAFERLLTDAREQLKEAHQIHFGQVQKEASGEPTTLSLLLLHAEDHLMSTQTMLDLTSGLVEMMEHKFSQK